MTQQSIDAILDEVEDYISRKHMPGVITEWLAILATEVRRLRAEKTEADKTD